MIKVSVFYPYTAGAKFDMAYYLEKHVALCKNVLGDALHSVAVDEGLNSMAPGSTPTYAAICHLCFDLPYEKVLELFSDPTMAADVPNFTDIQPAIQVSTVKL